MKNSAFTRKSLSITAFVALSAVSSHAALIAHYTFDTDNAGTTPDSVGSASATLGAAVSINSTVAGRIGNGALEMTASNGTVATSVDGAVTSNAFSWASDARTVTFWWKAKTPVDDNNQGTYISFGDTSGSGTRFDIKESHAGATTGNLRVEVQGFGATTDPAGFDDGGWHFVAVTVSNNAEFQNISWFVDGSSTDLNGTTDTTQIATGTSSLVFGDSIVTAPSPNEDNRTPNGYIDDFQLYDEVLTPSQISSLFNNPGSVIPEPSAALLGGIGALLLLRRRR